MGVSGAGKSTLGRALATRLGRAFVEGDDHHTAASIAKMAAGEPLSDADREDWIAALCVAMRGAQPCVASCSALNDTVRTWLAEGLGTAPLYLWLDGSRAEIAARLAGRDGHFMPPALLDSQFAALEPPRNAVRIALDGSPDAVLARALAALDDEAQPGGD